MPPYRKEIKLKCQYHGCNSSARWEVYDSRNTHYGNYCLRHAKMKVAEITKQEDEAVADRRWLEQFGEPE